MGWWPLNDGAGITALDLSGKGTNGTINNPNGGLGVNGSVWLQDAERGMVLSFNGVNGTGACVIAGTIPAMDLKNDFTWMFWCKQDVSQGFTSSTGGNDVILGNRYGGTTAPLQFIKFTPTNFEWYNADNTNFVNYPDIPSGVWVHNATVKRGTKLTYYRDGVEVLSITLTKTVTANPLYMGADGYSGVQEAWCGSLSDVRLYNKALTRLEVLAAMKGVARVDMEVAYAVVPPVLDGEVDSVWALASTSSFVPLADPADGSGTWKVLYDANNLYVLVEVTDDSLKNDSAGAWQDDSVEVYFDGGNTKLSTALSGDDHQYTFGWTATDIQGTNITGYTAGIEQAQATTATGWRIEIKMPWLAIQGKAPQARGLIGIDCYYNDDDDGGDTREGKMLSYSAVEGWNNASVWATAVLAAVPVPVDPGTTGLAARYAFENDVKDSSSNHNDGLIMGKPTWIDGAQGKALEFHGLGVSGGGGDYIMCALARAWTSPVRSPCLSGSGPTPMTRRERPPIRHPWPRR